MANQVALKRRINGATGAPSPVTGYKEGEVVLNFPGAAGGTTKPEMWAFDGSAFRRVNPDASIQVVSKTVPKGGATWATDVAAEMNAAAAVWTVTAGQVPIVTWNGNAYAFTGGAGTWGATAAAQPGTPTTMGMFAPLGASGSDPEVVDWSARTEADLGSAYTAWHTGAGTPDFKGGVSIVKWKDNNFYLLTNLGSPSNAGSYKLISKTPNNLAFYDWSARTEADIGAGYAAWHAGAGTPDFSSNLVLVKWKDNQLYALTNPAAPATVGSYQVIVPAIQTVDFKAAVDVTAGYPDPPTAGAADTRVPNGMSPGDFVIFSKTGTVDASFSSDGIQWATYGISGTVNQGDMAIWDGTNFHILPIEGDLSLYLSLSGGTMNDGASISFDTTAAQTGAAGTGGGNTAAEGAASVTVIDCDGGKIDGAVIDCGTY